MFKGKCLFHLFEHKNSCGILFHWHKIKEWDHHNCSTIKVNNPIVIFVWNCLLSNQSYNTIWLSTSNAQIFNRNEWYKTMLLYVSEVLFLTFFTFTLINQHLGSSPLKSPNDSSSLLSTWRKIMYRKRYADICYYVGSYLIGN